jgi:hypothetical protein
MKIKYMVFPPAVLYCNVLKTIQLQQLTGGKTVQNFQLSLFYNLQEIIQKSTFHRKYDLLFRALPVLRFPDRNINVGRTGYSRHAMLRSLIVKHLEGIKSIPRLLEFLDAHPVLAEMCGFKMGAIPDESQFYRFMQKTPNSVFEKLHLKINHKLVDQGIVTLDTFIMDSKPVMAATRENNFKNPNRNCRDKKKKPKRNPTATLGYYSYQKFSEENKSIFFWGYRTHVIVSRQGIPLVEKTLPNSVSDAEVACILIKKLKRCFRFKKNSIFIGDKAYDLRKLYNLVVNTMKSQVFIPLNPRNTQEAKIFGPKGAPLCEAGLEMKPAGVWIEGLRKRSKFRCPIKSAPSTQLYPVLCPVENPRFANLYGCTTNLDITNDARSLIPRDTDFFKNIYRQRQIIEQYFSRLGDREVEQTTHYKLRSVQNQITIAHLSMSLVAAAAGILLKQPEKIRCFRTFAAQTLNKVA